MTRHARVIVLAAAVLALGAGGYALAFARGRTVDPFAPRVQCSGGGLATASGAAPSAARTAYLVFGDGASVQTAVPDRRYSFTFAPSQTGTPWLLRFVDGQGHRRDVSLTRSLWAACILPTPETYLTRPHGPETTLERATDLVNRASELAFRTSPLCSQQEVPPPGTTVTDAPPPKALLAVLGVLRRPQTPEERQLGSHLPDGVDLPSGRLEIFARALRLVHLDGHTFRIATGIGQMSLPRNAMYPCQAVITRIVLRLARSQPAAVARDALRMQRAYKLGPETHGTHLWLGFSGLGGTAGMFDPRRFRTGGYFLTGGSGGPGRPQEWDVNGLVPDGVSSIVLELSGRSRPKPIFGRSSPYYRLHPYRVTVSVVQNVFAFLNLPADPESAAHKTITWLSASGAPIRVMSLP